MTDNSKEEATQGVTELVMRLKRAVEQGVGDQLVIGEIGSCKAAGSGHVYFTLKDSKSQLQCILYRYQAASCSAELREGLQVELLGRATVWEGRGALQFIVKRARAAGQGALQEQFEALKRKLEAEGLFSQERKKPLPEWPSSLGLITSPTGAVIEDMRHRLESRAPWMDVYFYPCQVQGKGAAEGLARAIHQWSNPDQYGLPAVDYLILARGGGSMEDLWCFNEEVLARAIAACPIPIISAVGHETDFTIADFVADLRAPTPTAAIELSTPDGQGLDEWLAQMGLDLRRRIHRALETAQLRLRLAEQSRLRSPHDAIAPFAQLLDRLEEDFIESHRSRLLQENHRLDLLAAKLNSRSLLEQIQSRQEKLSHMESHMRQRCQRKLEQEDSHLNTLCAQLRAASPQNALDRGFALVQSKQGKLLRDASDATAGEELVIRLSKGSIHAKVTK